MEPQKDLITNLLVHPKAAACDLCDSEGERANPNPSCVSACPHDAAIRMTGPELLERVRGGD
jgi:Fe-S-cluster-containing dehydrogenase component